VFIDDLEAPFKVHAPLVFAKGPHTLRFEYETDIPVAHFHVAFTSASRIGTASPERYRAVISEMKSLAAAPARVIQVQPVWPSNFSNMVTVRLTDRSRPVFLLLPMVQPTTWKIENEANVPIVGIAYTVNGFAPGILGASDVRRFELTGDDMMIDSWEVLGRGVDDVEVERPEEDVLVVH